MGNFLNYLDDFDRKQNHKLEPKYNKQIVEKIVVKEPEKKSKVLCLNVEVRTVDGANLVIEKLQEWITKQNGEVVKPIVESIKKITKPIPKKVVGSPIDKVRFHAYDILEGMSDEIDHSNIIQESNNINTNVQQFNNDQTNLETVAGHASALL